MTNFWDADGDFDYEAHFEAGQRENAAATAEGIGYPGLTDVIHYFGLQGSTESTFTAELLALLDTWRLRVEEIEAAPDTQDVKELQRHAEAAERTIRAIIDTPT
ncbi:hypothetical protein GU243_24215 (plasmid) [Pseudarthrobacter psychrotolerans]|uniref:Uncharacterized protein n=1 Tax=Pseudarthrobacter psychrotolerans TaxID=2697569 RepID=A0A6P1NVU6_9MICC|nr:hypothetical protein [Pseudarthrobacter psychrotolerans]QHK22664.1 hypothetical protein GU243_24215 [Pseudarthrobacter psychrotolerans]